MRNDDRIRVLIAESGNAVGGTERVVWELATRLPRERFDVRVWLSPAPGVDELAAALEEREVAVERVAEVDSRWDWNGMLRTWRALKRAKPDVLHVHHVWPAADRYLASIAGAAGVPHLVVTEHIVGESHSGGQRALKRSELGRAGAITAVCGAVADSIARDYGVPRGRVRVVPNGTDAPDEEAEWPLARTHREAFGASPLRPLWVCAARLERQKGQDVLLEAAAELKRRGLSFTLALAGDGSCRAALERQAEALGLGPAVEFLGQVDNVSPLLLAADAVVLPSRWEGLPLTLLEAMAHGRPVVATAVGGIPEAVEDGVTGRLVPPEDPVALADALEAFHRKPDAAHRIGHEGARQALERFSWTRMVEGFEAIYDEVLGFATFDPSAPRGVSAPGGGR